jgi:hypothetical protein
MGNKQQTAVEWFAKQLYDKMEMKGDGNIFDKLLDQAKAMEKEQIINGWDNGFLDYQISMHEDAEQYYIDTYGE